MSPPPAPRIRLDGIGMRFAGARHGAASKIATPALADVSFDIAAGAFVCLLGPSGCGKSTILNLIAGLEAPTAGSVLFDGQPVTGPSPERGMVFQQPTLFPWLSVIDNVTFGPRMAGVPAKVYRPAAAQFLQLVGLDAFEHHAPWQLSGGMRQRAALARAWMPNPDILLMDEPFGALDAQTRLMMQELLIAIWDAKRTTVLFVTHDVDEALYLADRVLVMSARPGRILDDLAVPQPRPRDIEGLVSDPEVAELRRHILRRLRLEVQATSQRSEIDRP